MPSKKRKVTYEEEVSPDEHKVEVTKEEHSDGTDTSLTEQDDERYTPADGR